MGKKGTPHRRYSKEEKLRIVKMHLDEHKSVMQIERETGIQNTLVCAWVKKYIVKYNRMLGRCYEEKKNARGAQAHLSRFREGINRSITLIKLPLLIQKCIDCSLLFPIFAPLGV